MWGGVVLAALGALAALAFYTTAGKPLPHHMMERVASNAPELRRQAAALGGRPVWKFDLGMVVGSTIVLLGLGVRGPTLHLTALGAFLALLSLTGRLLVLGGRRRLHQIAQLK